jgi:hypothetical protein
MDAVDALIAKTYALRICEGRLTLTAATPVTSADVTAATTLRFTPYGGSRIALYDGSAWNVRSFSEFTIAVPATTSTMYDVWVFDNAGTPTLEVLAWTNDTTRATALTTQDGVLVKTGALTRRYVGSFRTTTVSGQTESSFREAVVWNYYNRVRRGLRVTEATSSWAVHARDVPAGTRDGNQSGGRRVGVAEALLSVRVRANVANTSGGVNVATGIGEDSTSTVATGCLMQMVAAGANIIAACECGSGEGAGRRLSLLSVAGVLDGDRHDELAGQCRRLVRAVGHSGQRRGMTGWRLWVLRACIVELLLVLGYVTLIALQSQETINMRLQVATDNLQQRVERLEREDAAGRLRVLESDMTEVKYLARGVTVALIVQLFIAGRAVKRREPEEV